jgi:thiol-disulfide isomerase/thioredoxin
MTSLFSKNSKVIELTPNDFDRNFKVIHPASKDKKSMIFFGASWCGHCKRAKPEYEKTAAILGMSFPLFQIK